MMVKIKSFLDSMKVKVKYFLKILFFFLISFLKQVSFYSFLAYITYVGKINSYKIITFTNYKDILKKNNLVEKNINGGFFLKEFWGVLKENEVKSSLLKAYSFFYHKGDFYIKNISRVPLFKYEYYIYDKEGYKILEKIDESAYSLNQVRGGNENFMPIFSLFKNISSKIDLEYTGIKWNVYIYKKNQKFLIILPVEIKDEVYKKIEALTTNEDEFFQDGFSIIDLRFGKDKIYLVKP